MSLSIEDQLDSIMAVDEVPVPSETTAKSAFPVYPSEDPTKVDLQRFVETWFDDLNGIGYAPFWRDELPPEFAKLMPRDLLPIPRGTEETRKMALETENARISAQNLEKAAEKSSRLSEWQNRLSYAES